MKLIRMFKLLLKQMSCNHKDIRYKLPVRGYGKSAMQYYSKKNHKYVEICTKCGASRYR